MRSLSPSSAHRWANCYGSVALCEDEPYTASEPARLGNGVHAVIEYCVKRNHETVPAGLLGGAFVFEYQNAPSTIIIDNEVQRNVNTFLAEVKNHFLRLFVADGSSPALVSEVDIDLKHVHPNMKGRSRPFRADVVLEGLNEIVVMDYKNGFVAVPLETEHGINEQMVCYGEGVRFAGLGLHKYVTLVIVQPRSQNVPDVQTLRCDAKVIADEAYDKLRPAAIKAMSPEPELHAGTWCRFCPAIAKCPEVAAEAGRQSEADFAKYSTSVSTTMRMPETMDADKLSRVLSWLPIFDHWSKEVAAYAERKALGGAKVPGYKLVRGRGSRSWPVDAWGQLRDAGVAETLKPAELYSPHELEKMGVDKKIIAAIAIRHDGALTLVPESDKRAEQPLTNGFDNYGVS